MMRKWKLVDQVYEEINTAIKERKAEYTIVIRDFNAKIGEC